MAVSTQALRSISVSASGARTILRLNAWASVATAVLVLIASRSLIATMGFGRGAVLALVGALILYGLDAFRFSVRRKLKRTHVIAFALGNAACVIGGVALLALGPDALTLPGRVPVLIVAVAFGWLSLAGLRAGRHL